MKSFAILHAPQPRFEMRDVPASGATGYTAVACGTSSLPDSEICNTAFNLTNSHGTEPWYRVAARHSALTGIVPRSRSTTTGDAVSITDDAGTRIWFFTENGLKEFGQETATAVARSLRTQMTVTLPCHENNLTVRGLIAHLLTQPIDARMEIKGQSWTSNLQAADVTVCRIGGVETVTIDIR